MDVGWDLPEAVRRSGISNEQLWLAQILIGGTLHQHDVDAYTAGALIPDPHTHDLLIHALYEHLLDTDTTAARQLLNPTTPRDH